jgi:hypothetical protein
LDRARVLEFVHQNQIEDALQPGPHFGFVQQLQSRACPGSWPQYKFTSSPLSSLP